MWPIYYHAKANTKYVNPNFNKKRDHESNIISLDANLLYSTALCYKLSYREPKFDNDISKYTIEYVWNLDPNGDYYYIFNVDLHYPKKLHDRDFEFPLLCDHSIPSNEKIKKLMWAFYDKKNYSISLLNLKYYFKKGLILKENYHVIYAKQSNFMKPYINFNNEKRTECSKNKDKFPVDQCKLYNNSLFGKQIEDNEKCKDTRIANNEEKAKQFASKIALKNWHILSEDVTLCELRKSNVLFDKPISIGFMVLEKAKFEINIHYDRLTKKFCYNIMLLYTDTDSFKLLIKNCNPYE